MRVQVVGAAAAGGVGYPLSTFVVDGVLAVDAGALGWFDTPARQAAVRDVLLTHAHLDHIAGLPAFIENVYRLTPDPPVVHAHPATLKSLRDHLFNDALMPDFVALSDRYPPFLRLCPFTPGVPFRVGRYEVTAVAVDHLIPTVAYLIDDGRAAVAVVTDTAPVPDVLAELARAPRLRAVFLEASFPDSMAELAAISGHLTASQFLAAARLFPPGVTVRAVHVKPRFVDPIGETVRAAGLPNVAIAAQGEVVEV